MKTAKVNQEKLLKKLTKNELFFQREWNEEKKFKVKTVENIIPRNGTMKYLGYLHLPATAHTLPSKNGV